MTVDPESVKIKTEVALHHAFDGMDTTRSWRVRATYHFDGTKVGFLDKRFTCRWTAKRFAKNEKKLRKELRAFLDSTQTYYYTYGEAND